MSNTVARAIRVVEQHPSVKEVGIPTVDDKTRNTTVEVTFDLELPNAWMAEGVSPNGVFVNEVVTLVFSPNCSLVPPEIYLRRDFDRSLAHVQPGSPDEPPVPCIYDGDLRELLQQQGLYVILSQLKLWLENAALGRLIDPKQGWEPVRRDNADGLIVADVTYLESVIRRSAGFAVFPFAYLRYPPEDLYLVYGEVQNKSIKLHPSNLCNLIAQKTDAHGRSLAILVWSDETVIADRYRPETVTDMESLRGRAAEYGCDEPLRIALHRLQECARSFSAISLPIAIILCARRPFHLIGSASSLEFCPYIVEVTGPQLFLNTQPIRPTQHRHVINRELLGRMSGNNVELPVAWVQLGAGSIGSKIALHLARAGQAPSIVIDRTYLLSPYHAARHALVPMGQAHIEWVRGKAEGLASAIQGLGQSTKHYSDDVINAIRDQNLARRILPEDSRLIVNSTASLAVREALASVRDPNVIPRVVETLLFARGAVGLFSVEGPSRNPDIGDLITETYALMREDARLQAVVFTNDEAMRRQETGQGCGSTTMVMTDARISMFAASMAEVIGGMLQTQLPDGGGRIILGAMQADRISIEWQSHDITPFERVIIDNSPSWSVHVAPRAHRKIQDEVGRWPIVETGGILLGRFSEPAQTFYVIDVLPAPEDSERSADQFVLGTHGVLRALERYSESCRYALYCLGTWHSHLRSSGASVQDRSTAAALAQARIVPSVLLIHTRRGYRAVLAEALSSRASSFNVGSGLTAI